MSLALCCFLGRSAAASLDSLWRATARIDCARPRRARIRAAAPLLRAGSETRKRSTTSLPLPPVCPAPRRTSEHQIGWDTGYLPTREKNYEHRLPPVLGFFEVRSALGPRLVSWGARSLEQCGVSLKSRQPRDVTLPRDATLPGDATLAPAKSPSMPACNVCYAM